MTGKSADSVLIVHPSRLLCDGLADSLRDSGIEDVRHAQVLPDAMGELARRPATVTIGAVEAAPSCVSTLVTSLLDAGSTSVVVLAPTVQEAELLGALEAGALGYVGRDEELDRLVFDIRGALRGEACIPRDKLAPVLRLLIERRRAEDERSERLGRLSTREREVLAYLVEGGSNADIAAALFLSQATVRTHVQNILTKLEVHSRLEAIALAHEHGVTAPSGVSGKG